MNSKITFAGLGLIVGIAIAYVLHIRCLPPFDCITNNGIAQPSFEPVPTCDTCGWNVTVIVRDLAGPVEGATVTLTCLDGTFTTNGDGKVDLPYRRPCGCDFEDDLTATEGDRTVSIPMATGCGGYTLMLPTPRK